jgi:nicotinamidase/pyrazinamidase
MKALLIVDVQNDFCPGGALESPQGERIIPIINQLSGRFDTVIASRDDHPPESEHFKKWPIHCVAGSEGARFHPDLDTSKIEQELVKGTSGKDDGYSAFEATNVNLKDYLKKKNIDEIYITGLTTEYCVKETAIDASKAGFKTYVVSDAIGAVKPESDDEMEAFVEMKSSGVVMIRAAQI